jgi:nitrogen-specific signal transduction histidine kinase
LRAIQRGLPGQDKYADEFVLSMNRAAERAAPEAKAVFLNVIRNMTVPDAAGVIRGPDDAATSYFRRNSERELFQKFHPLVAQTTARVGVTRQYKKMVQRLAAELPFDARQLDVDAYVTQKALDGLFLFVAQEEKRIRTDPAARTTEVLRKVFGGQ